MDTEVLTSSPSSGERSDDDGDESSTTRSVRRLLLVNFLLSLTFWSPLWIVYLQDGGMALATVGFLETFGLVIQFSLGVPAGLLIDRFGRRPSIVIGAASAALGVWLMGTEIGSLPFFAGFALQRASVMLVNGALLALRYEILWLAGRTQEYPRLVGRFSAVVEGGGAVAGLVAGLVARGPGLDWLFPLSSLSLAVAAVIALRLPEPRPRAVTTTSEGFRAVMRAALAALRRNTSLRYQVLFGSVSVAGTYLLLYVLVQPYAVAVGVSVATLGILTAVLRVATLSAAIMAHSVIERLGSQRTILVAAAMLALTPLPLAGLPIAWIVVLFIVAAVGRGILGPTLSTEFNRHLSMADRATIQAVRTTGSLLFLAAAQPLTLGVFGSSGATAGMLAAFALFVVPGAVLLHLWRTAEKTTATPLA